MTALLMLEGGSRQVLTRGEDVTFNIINLLRPWDDQSSGKLQFGAVSLDNRRNLDTSDYNLGGHVFTFKVKAEQSFQVIAKYEGQDVMYSPLHLSVALAPNDEEDNLMETSVMKVGSPDVEVVDASGPSSPRSGSSPAPVQTEVKKLQCHIHDDGHQKIVRLGPRPAEEMDIMKDPETETFVRGSLGLGNSLGNLKIQDIDTGSDDSWMPPITIDFTKIFQWKMVSSVPKGGLAGLEHPIGIAVLEDRFVVSSKNDCKVKMYKKDGTFIKELSVGVNRGDFNQPSDMVTLKNGEDFALRERHRVVVLNKEGKLISIPWRSTSGGMRPYGLAQDERNQLVCLKETNNKTFIDVYNSAEAGKRLYSIDLEDVIGDAREKSLCRFMTYHGGKFYITDLGRDLIIILESEGQGVKVFGGSGTGPGQFWDPAGLAVDDLGNFIVADSRNHRLQLIGQDRKWIRNVKLCPPVRRPSAVVLDRKRRELYVLNLHGENAVVKYSPQMKK